MPALAVAVGRILLGVHRWVMAAPAVAVDAQHFAAAGAVGIGVGGRHEVK